MKMNDNLRLPRSFTKKGYKMYYSCKQVVTNFRILWTGW